LREDPGQEDAQARTPYAVYVPKALSGGRVERRYFKARADAMDFARECQSKLSGLGSNLWQDLTPEETAEMAAHAQRLREQRGREPMTARKALEEFYRAQTSSRASARYLEHIRYEGRKFQAKFGDRNLAGIGRDEILKWLHSFKGISATSRFVTFRVVSAIFGYAV